MKEEMKKEQGDIRFDVTWTTLGEYLEYLEKRGVSVNVASFVGAATVRIHELGQANRAPTAEELERMRDTGPRRDGARRNGGRQLAYLCARLLCEDR